jgi:hypothetical protein
MGARGWEWGLKPRGPVDFIEIRGKVEGGEDERRKREER